MRALLLALIMLTLAGCATPQEPASVAVPEASAPFPSEVIMHDCVEHAVDIPVDMAEAQRFLPQGMKPAPLGPSGMAIVEVISVTCKSEVAEGGDAAVFLAWMVVQPPEEVRAADLALHLFLFAMTTDDQAVASALNGLGVPATVAPTTSTEQQTPVLVMGRGEAKAAEWGAVIETKVPTREVQRSHPIFRLLIGDATGVTGAVDVDAGSHPHYDMGEGSLTVTGKPPFPAPTTPGVSVYGYKGHLGFAPVPLDPEA